ncbi:MAG: hypothetical protein FJ225_03765 [Lentisphaerae bacterium]|nr:hypothetical protein [Lentisphaerota bacterium]
MLERLVIAGSGGQGILLVGRILAGVAVDEVPHVTFFPAYGAEVRGGASNCEIVLSSDPISSPVSDEFDSMLLMNEESARKYLARRARNCLVILNGSLCPAVDDPSTVSVAATELADRLGDTRAANFIMLGAYIARKPVVPAAALEAGIRAHLAAKAAASTNLNIRALRAGLSA